MLLPPLFPLPPLLRLRSDPPSVCSFSSLHASAAMCMAQASATASSSVSLMAPPPPPLWLACVLLWLARARKTGGARSAPRPRLVERLLTRRLGGWAGARLGWPLLDRAWLPSRLTASKLSSWLTSLIAARRVLSDAFAAARRFASTHSSRHAMAPGKTPNSESHDSAYARCRARRSTVRRCSMVTLRRQSCFLGQGVDFVQPVRSL